MSLPDVAATAGDAMDVIEGSLTVSGLVESVYENFVGFGPCETLGF